jgi:hypothetical protein
MTQRSSQLTHHLHWCTSLLHLLLSIAVLGLAAYGQCTAPVAPAAGSAPPPDAPTLDVPISAGASHVTGTGTAGYMVVICIDGKPTDPTATVAYDNSYEAPLSVPLKTGQVVTAQQYKTGTTDYSPLSVGVAVSETVSTCLEALSSGECQFRVQIDTSAAIGNGSQTNTNTTPNILVTLDYLWHPPQDTKHLVPFLAALNEKITIQGLKPADVILPKKDMFPHLAVHAHGKFGFTQTFAASSVQPTATNGGTAPSCPSKSQSASSPNCMLAVPKAAFIGELGGKFGGATGVDDAGFYSEFGLHGRGSFQYLIPRDQIVQNNGASYIDLSSVNPHNVVGFYEIVGYAQVAQHDKVLSTFKVENTSPLLVVEGGYQNNRGLAQLLPASPGTSTRSRYVGRFSFNYEVSKSTHSQVSFGVEYSGGINGGPHVVQLFIGGNLNPAKLFSKSGS